jgi:hypothetical protein
MEGLKNAIQREKEATAARWKNLPKGMLFTSAIGITVFSAMLSGLHFMNTTVGSLSERLRASLGVGIKWGLPSGAAFCLIPLQIEYSHIRPAEGGYLVRSAAVRAIMANEIEVQGDSEESRLASRALASVNVDRLILELHDNLCKSRLESWLTIVADEAKSSAIYALICAGLVVPWIGFWLGCPSDTVILGSCAAGIGVGVIKFGSGVMIETFVSDPVLELERGSAAPARLLRLYNQQVLEGKVTNFYKSRPNKEKLVETRFWQAVGPYG